jgi:hypothetical protein
MAAIPGPSGEAETPKPKRKGRDTSTGGGGAAIVVVGVVAAVFFLRRKRGR